MDINELLTTARYWIGAAQDKETPLDEAAWCAAIAQACAQTAQAMILNERSTLTIERIGEYVKATMGMYPDPNDTREAAFYDANIADWRKEQEEQA